MADYLRFQAAKGERPDAIPPATEDKNRKERVAAARAEIDRILSRAEK